MKLTLVGGGAHRYASAARTILGREDLDVDEIALYDLNHHRVETMARFIEKTPEFAARPCTLTWDRSLEEALDGADMVCIVIFVGTPLTHERAMQACGRHGFVGTQQLTPSGAVNATRIGAVALDIARRMERCCPEAWLLDFANPVSVVSGVINHHTKIRGMGICEGYRNHLWDIPRLFGRDELATGLDVHASGVNHVSFIEPGSTWKGRDLYAMLDELVASGPWTPPRLSDRWPGEIHDSILRGLEQLLLLYRRYGRLPFSTEGDGMASLNMSEVWQPRSRKLAALSQRDVEEGLRALTARRKAADDRLASFVRADTEDVDWENPLPGNDYLRADPDNLMVLLARARAGQTVRVATSVPNRGAIADLPDRYLVEFTQVIENGQMRPSRPHRVPDVLYGWVASFAAHQTLLADAIAADDPRLFVQALSAYPVHRDTEAFWSCWREVVTISRDDLSANLARAVDLMPGAS